MIENRMTIDSEWLCMEDEDIEPGHFNRYGQFVKEEYLLEVQVKADDLIKQIENAKSNITTPELADIKHQVNTLTKGNLNSELEEHDINVDYML